MIVCHCNAVSEREIRNAVRGGARNCQQVGRACAAGRVCGGCRPLIHRIIETEPASTLALDEIAAAAS